MKNLKIALLIVAVISSSNASGASEPLKGGASMPRKELLRPMILPKGGWQIDQTIGLLIGKNSLNGKYEAWHNVWIQSFIEDASNKFETYGSLFGLFPRFAVSDRVEFNAFPLPYITVLITDSDIGYSSDGTLNRFAMTFEGGCTGLTIAQAAGVKLNFATGINTKLLLSDRWWHEQQFWASYAGILQRLSLSETVGLQCSDIIATTMVVYGSMNWMTSSTSFIAGGEIHLIANLSQRFSVDVFGGGQAGRIIQFQKNNYYGSAGTRLIVQW
jgi:hypothetical protein